MTDENSLIPRRLVVILYEWIDLYFNDQELSNLCFRLGFIEYDSLSGSNKGAKVQELATHCWRHGLLPELVQQLESLRPRQELPAEVKQAVERVNFGRLDRSNWLKAHGFPIDPFLPDAFRAEVDPLFKKQGMPAFVDFPDFERLKGTPSEPGYRFIFAPKGGGKTTLRKQIVAQFDQDVSKLVSLRIPDQSLVLAVEYIGHDYNVRDVSADAHVRRIVELVAQKVKVLFRKELPLETGMSAKEMLENVVASVKNIGPNALCILIDNLQIQPGRSPASVWRLIQSLTTDVDLLSIEGIMFKFLLPNEILEQAEQMLPAEYVHIVQWQKDGLTRVLGERLLACMDTQILVEGSANKVRESISGLVETNYENEFVEAFIEIGLESGQPREMWRLGHYLLDQHFKQSNTNLQEELI